MYRDARGHWTEPELRGLLTSYFGHKLDPSQLDQLVTDVAEALAERSRTAPVSFKSDLGGCALDA